MAGPEPQIGLRAAEQPMACLATNKHTMSIFKILFKNHILKD